MSQEEIRDATGQHASGEAVQRLEGSLPPVKTVPILALFQQQPELESISLHTAAHLVSKQKSGFEQDQYSSL